jgi:hypothetical protein
MCTEHLHVVRLGATCSMVARGLQTGNAHTKAEGRPQRAPKLSACRMRDVPEICQPSAQGMPPAGMCSTGGALCKHQGAVASSTETAVLAPAVSKGPAASVETAALAPPASEDPAASMETAALTSAATEDTALDWHYMYLPPRTA